MLAVSVCVGQDEAARPRRDRGADDARARQEMRPTTRESDRARVPRRESDAPGDFAPDRRPGPLRRGILDRHLFRPQDSDWEPVLPEEAEELLDFTRQHVPRVHGLLARLRERDPAEFQRKLDELASRLRQLRRIFAEDPRLGRLVVSYFDNTQTILRIGRALRGGVTNDVQRERMRLHLRDRLAENLRIERRVLHRRAEQLEAQRDEFAAARIERLTNPETDLAGEPPVVRELVDAWFAATDEAARNQVARRLRQLVTQRIDREISALRDQARRLAEEGPAEIDRRIAEISERPAERPRRP